MLPAIQIAGDVTWTASGSIGPFRYAELYNDTETIGWWDFGDSITLADTENFTVDFAQDGVITIG